MNDPTTATPVLQGVVAMVLVDLKSAQSPWGWMRVVRGSSALHHEGLLFSKVMGSGHDGGFSLRPSATHQGLLCLFDCVNNAEQFFNSDWVKEYREHSREFCQGLLAITDARGSWDGQAWGLTPPDALQDRYPDHVEGEPMAALTRASIKFSKAVTFWRYAPPAQDSLLQADGCQLAMGLGEAPMVRQCTMSVWRDNKAMDAYARQGAHQKAIQAAYRHDFFSESMFIRMRLLELHGLWKGQTLKHSSAQTQGVAHV